MKELIVIHLIIDPTLRDQINNIASQKRTDSNTLMVDAIHKYIEHPETIPAYEGLDLSHVDPDTPVLTMVSWL
jgi:hypothetical protein